MRIDDNSFITKSAAKLASVRSNPNKLRTMPTFASREICQDSPLA